MKAQPTELTDNDDLSFEGKVAELLEAFVQSGRSTDESEIEAFIAANSTYAGPLRECLDGLALLHSAVDPVDAPKPRRVLQPGDLLGDYEIIKELGRGAMGVVYHAHQRTLNRPVALKVFSPVSSSDPARVQRFQREAMAAASLEEPNIVPVYDIDQIDGVQFYVMRLIDGTALDCPGCAYRQPPSDQDEQNRQRAIASSFADVASALAATHRLGVIHRDVKPSNLLLDRWGKVWISDFGLARVSSLANLTVSGDVVGTLRYMSPEQASGRSEAIDRRSDIYSLGATLYEVATRSQIFSEYDGLRLLRQLQSGFPPPIEQTSTGPCHAVPINRDLLTIVNRAMRPDKSDRYADADEMSADLKRFAAGKPIMATPASFIERMRGLSRRHSNVITAICLITIALLSLSLIHNLILRGEQLRTESALRSAATNYDQARAAVDNLGIEIAEQLEGIPGSEAIRHQILERSLRYYQRFIESSQSDTELAAEVAMTHWKIARLLTKLGEYQKADLAYETAIEQLCQSTPQRGQTNLHQALNERAMLRSNAGDHAGALRLLRQIKLPKDAESEANQYILAMTLNHFGIVYQRLDRIDDAITLIHRSMDQLRNPASIPHDATNLSSGTFAARQVGTLADAMNNLAAIMSDAGRSDDALTLAQQSTQLRGTLPLTQQSFPRVAIGYSNLGTINRSIGANAEAIKAFEAAIEAFEKAIDRLPPNNFPVGETSQAKTLRCHFAITLSNLAMLLQQVGRPREAEQQLQKAITVLQPTFESDSDDASVLNLHANLIGNLAALLNQQGKPHDASRLLTRTRIGPESVLRSSALNKHRSINDQTFPTHLITLGLGL
ncbi:protein kinase domain-containing protein [Roseiconus lacunae]|uniref:serine/threonine-protein kinase n=1 Tax=Roseiconus lacunae TaxID=2605694 RepID=UPI001E421003|nr:serine/threonine-protein kinase [Roseiconus lacunae]MCD0460555.1 serine/threonine-protein kinase [Roseiconus lacunae]